MVHTVTRTKTIVVDPSGNILYPDPTKPTPELYDTPHVTPAPSPSNDGDHGKDKDTDKDKPTSEYSDGDVTLPGGSWVRKAYYDAASQTAEGLVFMNHRGGQGSGVWDK